MEWYLGPLGKYAKFSGRANRKECWLFVLWNLAIMVPLVLINPILTPLGPETTSSYEGCLSVPGMRARVVRHARIRLQGFDHRAQPIDEELEDWNAIVAQHECDHLDGVIYIDRCDTTTLAYEDTFREFLFRTAADYAPFFFTVADVVERNRAPRGHSEFTHIFTY